MEMISSPEASTSPVKKLRKTKRHKEAMRISFSYNSYTNFMIILLIAIAAFCAGCDNPPEENPEIIGDSSWYDKNSQEQQQYLLKTFQGRGDINSVIDWPPDNLRRIVDISVDVTGSGFTRESLYQGRRMSLAEHNLRKLIDERLVKELKPGDKIMLRIYGSMPGGENVNVDEKMSLEFPADKIDVDVRNPSRKNGQVQVIVKKVDHADLGQRKQLIEQILNWFLGFIRQAELKNGRFEASPLFQFIRNICSQYSTAKDTPKLLIFVTDGHFKVGDLYYDPSTYRQRSHSIDRIKTIITTSRLKPFTESIDKTKIMLFGLYSDGDEGFKQAQEDIFHWYFAPQPVELLANQ